VSGKKPPKGAANQEGRPWQRADGRWCMRLYPPAGTIWKRPKYIYGKTRAECKASHDKAKAEQARGLGAGGGDVLIGDYLHHWLNVTLPQYVLAGEMSYDTMIGYQEIAEVHIIPEPARGVPSLREVGLLELTAPMTREWRDGLLSKPSRHRRTRLRPGETELPPPALLGPRSVNYARAILRKAVADAIRDEVAGLTRNVVDLVGPVKDRGKAAKVVITADQAAALLVAMADDPLWCYWLLAFALGFRRGEGLGMRWADLDLAALTWTPGQQVKLRRGARDPATGQRGKGHLISAPLKTQASGQPVAIPAAAAQALSAWATEQKKTRLAASRWADLDLVFTTGLGTALSPRNVNRSWELVCARAGTPGVRLHDLRHACGSFLLAQGVDSKQVQRALRHARLATTELYLHALEEVPRGAADAMDEIISGLRAAGKAAQ
jgi:integrase